MTFSLYITYTAEWDGENVTVYGRVQSADPALDGCVTSPAIPVDKGRCVSSMKVEEVLYDLGYQPDEDFRGTIPPQVFAVKKI